MIQQGLTPLSVYCGWTELASQGQCGKTVIPRKSSFRPRVKACSSGRLGSSVTSCRCLSNSSKCASYFGFSMTLPAPARHGKYVVFGELRFTITHLAWKILSQSHRAVSAIIVFENVIERLKKQVNNLKWGSVVLIFSLMRVYPPFETAAPISTLNFSLAC